MTTPKRDRVVIPVTIGSGASQSQDLVIGSLQIVGIQMPAGWDAAGITFLALTREAAGPPKVPTYAKVQDAGGTEVAITAPVADTYVAIAPTVALTGLGRIKLRSGTAGTPVNQTAQRDFFLVCLT